MRANERPRDGHKVFHTLRESILRLELRPGSVVDEASLCEHFNVSRTPVREALIQLVSEGLIIRDGRSARVAPLDFSELPKLFDALLISSRLINRMAASNRTDRDLAAIFSAMQKFEECALDTDSVLVQDANVSFHLAISEAAQNHHISSFYERVLLASSRLALACFSSSEGRSAQESRRKLDLEEHVSETARQHTMIYEAILARDVEVADHLAAEHQKLYSTRLQALLFSGASKLNELRLA